MAGGRAVWPEIFKLVRRNMEAKSLRTASTVVSTAMLIGLIFGGSLLYVSIDYSVALAASRLGADLMVTPKEGEAIPRIVTLSLQTRQVILVGPVSPAYMPKQSERIISAIGGVERVSPQLFVGRVEAGAERPVAVVAIEAASDFAVRPWFSGDLREALAKRGAVAGSRLPLGMGDTVSIWGTPFTVNGKLDETGTNLDSLIVISLENAYGLADQPRGEPLPYVRGQVSSILVKTSEARPLREVAFDIQKALISVDVFGKAEIVESIVAEVSDLTVFLTIMGASAWIMTTVLISAIFSLTVNERRKELGVLVALGARRAHIFSLIVLEVLILAALGGAFGVVAGGASLGLLASSLTENLGLPFAWPNATMISITATAALGVATATALVASAYPALLALRLDPYEAIRSGE